ncbi:MAG: M1 family peptidase [Chitinophagaceae bacterium]|nr:MAG: M1 family peptidase [Chitinophagaceae bacterium]
MKRHTRLLSVLALGLALNAHAQPDRWQQRVKYTMDVDMNVETNQYTGKQKVEYWNNSPDTLKRVFFHLYWNAFQPNSMMDARSRRQGSTVLATRNGREIVDWDQRVKDRILNLKPDEIGYERVSSIRMDGRVQKTKEHETILEVQLDKPILPKSKVTFDMDWTAQVPLQVRRSGRDNPQTTVRYTMTQWYPKLVEYDYEGWHPTPYVAREFYGVWGDYDVTIRIDKKYLLGGSGYIANPNEVGFGYEAKGAKPLNPTGKRTWKFTAPNVHDFAWAADPGYKHLVRQVPNGPTVNVLYKNPTGSADEDRKWNLMADAAVIVYPYIAKTFGPYPYKQYSFIHGGDGGMEYPNCTMLSGSGIGTAFHEWMHTWYQGMLATNESEHAWMDEGFTEWAAERVGDYYDSVVRRSKLPADQRAKEDTAKKNNLFDDIYGGFTSLVRSGREEPLTTHADQFNTNYAYSNAAYLKGAVFIEQLGYITGAAVRDRILLEYYRQWRFKHPNPNDFIRVAEKVSGLQLDWYRGYWVNTTKTIDYAVDSLWSDGSGTRVRLRNDGMMPMPIDLKITFKDGSSEWHYIPQYLQFGEKAPEPGQEGRKVYEAWKWTHPTYEISSGRTLTDIISVEIDPSHRMADMVRKNNFLKIDW